MTKEFGDNFGLSQYFLKAKEFRVPKKEIAGFNRGWLEVMARGRTAQEELARGDGQLSVADRERYLSLVEASQQARTSLILANLFLVVEVARGVQVKFNPANEQLLADLVQSGNQGLIEAADRYDPKRKTAFSTFAIMRIRFRVFEQLSTILGVSQETRRVALKAEEVASNLEKHLGRTPTEKEVAETMAIGVKKLANARRAARVAEQTELELEGDSQLEDQSLQQIMLQAFLQEIQSIDSRISLILQGLLEGISLKEMSERIGLCRYWAACLVRDQEVRDLFYKHF